jgi:hypothetical protein
MSRVDVLEIANTRELVIYSEVNVPVSTTSITAGNCIHNGILEFPNVFVHETNAMVKPVAYVVREYNSGAVLQKKNLVLVFFRNNLVSVTAGQVEKVQSAQALTGIEIGLSCSSSATYKDNNGNIVWAVKYGGLESSRYYITKDASNSLYFVVRAGENVQYDSNTTLTIGIWFCIT